jgi:hypothetical protein
VFRKCRDLWLPHAKVRDARVQQHDMRTVAFALVVDSRAIDPH